MHWLEDSNETFSVHIRVTAINNDIGRINYYLNSTNIGIIHIFVAEVNTEN
jgi:hypothetical protein